LTGESLDEEAVASRQFREVRGARCRSRLKAASFASVRFTLAYLLAKVLEGLFSLALRLMLLRRVRYSPDRHQRANQPGHRTGEPQQTSSPPTVTEEWCSSSIAGTSSAVALASAGAGEGALWALLPPPSGQGTRSCSCCSTSPPRSRPAPWSTTDYSPRPSHSERRTPPSQSRCYARAGTCSSTRETANNEPAHDRLVPGLGHPARRGDLPRPAQARHHDPHLLTGAAELIPDWYHAQFAADDDRPMTAASPDHWIFRHGAYGCEEIGGARHRFRDEQSDGFTIELNVEFPITLRSPMITWHCWHLASEFSNWLDFANGERDPSAT